MNNALLTSKLNSIILIFLEFLFHTLIWPPFWQGMHRKLLGWIHWKCQHTVCIHWRSSKKQPTTSVPPTWSRLVLLYRYAVIDSFSLDCSMEGNEYTNKCSTVHRKGCTAYSTECLFFRSVVDRPRELYLSNSFFTWCSFTKPMSSFARMLCYKFFFKWSTVVSPPWAEYNCVLPIIVLLCLLHFGHSGHLLNKGFGVVIKQYLSSIHFNSLHL